MPDGTVKEEIYEDVYPPDHAIRPFPKANFIYDHNLGKIFFGRFTYKDVFGDDHHSTFELKLGTDKIRVHSTPLPDCYSDWS